MPTIQGFFNHNAILVCSLNTERTSLCKASIAERRNSVTYGKALDRIINHRNASHLQGRYYFARPPRLHGATLSDSLFRHQKSAD